VAAISEKSATEATVSAGFRSLTGGLGAMFDPGPSFIGIGGESGVQPGNETTRHDTKTSRSNNRMGDP